MIMLNKRGQGLSTTAIILIILGVIILVVLIIGFTMGWENIAFWVPSDNVDTISSQCSIACTTQSTYDFCTRTRELKASDLPLEDGTRPKKVTKSCNDLAHLINADNVTYGIEDCPGLCLTEIYIWVVDEAECLIRDGTMSEDLTKCTSEQPEGSVCCYY
jgi:hypothetical protein